MKLIQELSDMIEEELKDAEKYIDKALDMKDDYPELAATFYKLSVEEIGHMTALHTQVVVLISDYEKKHGEPPSDMKAVYIYLHKKHMNCANMIKAKQGIFKETK